MMSGRTGRAGGGRRCAGRLLLSGFVGVLRRCGLRGIWLLSCGWVSEWMFGAGGNLRWPF